MALSWNEIRRRATAFSQTWQDASRESSESQSFYNDFFEIFGIERRKVATFEAFAKKLDGGSGRIDVFWRRILLIEHKSAGGDLEKARAQALGYTANMTEDEFPRYILLCDFQQFELYDLETEFADEAVAIFPLVELYKNVEHFGFIAGYSKRKFKDQEPVNIIAANLMGLLHDALVSNGYHGSELEQFLIRILFCLFAEDTTIFDSGTLKSYIEEQTKLDGSDLGEKLSGIFQQLNTHPDAQQTNIPITLEKFPYINGDLFAKKLSIVHFNQKMREVLLKCCAFDWSQISPAIFGAMFQSATDQENRRILGAHYTSEQNIMKIIEPLFLDELWAEFDKIKNQPKKLQEFHKKITKLKFLDPACGCGNFLIIAYRELRLLEIEILRKRYDSDETMLEISNLSQVDIHQFYGIEIEELPAKIAEVALWLTDHQMNLKLSETFGQYFARIPLSKFDNIKCANALRMEWRKLTKGKINYILGNPPFVGSSYQTPRQKQDMKIVFEKLPGAGVLDYITAWYLKAAEYIENTRVEVGFVSTNSITQGEQVAILWNHLFLKHDIKIHFAHRTFQWTNEAQGKAAVHCVIIGFANFDADKKMLYDYQDIKGAPQERIAKNINPYLLDAPNILVTKRSKPLADVAEISYGSKPVDGGFLLLDQTEKEAIILTDKRTQKFIRPFLGAREFLYNIPRYCIWLKDTSPNQYNDIANIMNRIKAVKKYREKSKKLPTRQAATIPYIFTEIRHPETNYLAIPEISSETRDYIPIGYIDKNTIASNRLYMVPNASLYEFAILTSAMHNCWIRYTAGRLKSDYCYSSGIVYNNFVWPQDITNAQKNKIASLGQAVLDARKAHPTSNLADLYNPLTMPPNLRNAHNKLDREVDKAYGKEKFASEAARVEYLFSLYYQVGLFASP